MEYYNGARTHLALNKDAPVSRAIQAVGRILPAPNSRRIAPSICSDLISDKDTTSADPSSDANMRRPNEADPEENSDPGESAHIAKST